MIIYSSKVIQCVGLITLRITVYCTFKCVLFEKKFVLFCCITVVIIFCRRLDLFLFETFAVICNRVRFLKFFGVTSIFIGILRVLQHRPFGYFLFEHIQCSWQLPVVLEVIGT